MIHCMINVAFMLVSIYDSMFMEIFFKINKCDINHLLVLKTL